MLRSSTNKMSISQGGESHKNGESLTSEGFAKIQWKQTQSVDYSKLKYGRKPAEIHWMYPLVASVLLSIVAEWHSSFGTFTLLFGLLLTGIYSLRAVPHDNIPLGPTWLPVIGHLWNAWKRYDDFYECCLDTFQRLGPEKKMFVASMPLQRNFVFFCDPKMFDQLFRVQFADCWKGAELSKAFSPILGHGIFLADGENWRQQRTTAMQLFTTRSLKDYMFEVFLETTQKMTRKLEELRGADGLNVIDWYENMHRLTLDAFVQVAFGVDIGGIGKSPQKLDFAEAFDRSFCICTKRLFDSTWIVRNWLNVGDERELKQHLKTIDDIIWRIVDERKQEFNNKSALAKQFDLLSMFLENEPEMSCKRLRDVALNFVVAGRDTTAQLLSWFTFEMSKPENKKVLEKMLDELDKVVGSNPLTDEVRYEHVSKLTYLDKCLLESLRLHPSVPHLVRYAKVDLALANGHIIRKGDALVYSTWAVARLPWVWEQPLEFRPERFEDASIGPAQMPAFNIPPRLCPGKHVALMEAKVAVAQLFRVFEVLPDANHKVQRKMSVTNQMRDGFKVRLKKRCFKKST